MLAKAQLLATEMTEMVITTLKIEGRLWEGRGVSWWREDAAELGLVLHFDAGESDGQHERGVLGVRSRAVEQDVRVGGNDQAHDEQGDDVEEGDAPEHLSCSLRDGLERVRGLRSSQTSELGAAESERRRDEDGAEAVKAVPERTVGVMPIATADVAAIVGRYAAAVDDDTEDDKAAAGNDLNGRGQLPSHFASRYAVP